MTNLRPLFGKWNYGSFPTEGMRVSHPLFAVRRALLDTEHYVLDKNNGWKTIPRKCISCYGDIDHADNYWVCNKCAQHKGVEKRG